MVSRSQVIISLSVLSLSLPQLGYGCIELEDSSKKGNMAPEEGEVLAGNGVALTPATSARAG